jgi:phosphoenolpyruvate carboxylase
MGRAFMGIVAASGLAKQVGMHNHPLFEVILPMTETAQEMIGIQVAFKELTQLKHPLLKFGPDDIKHIQLIPLFEDIHTIANSDKILEEYLEGHKWKFGFLPSYMRPYVARSDPALNAGIVPTVLAIKIALSGYIKLSEKFSIP